MHLSRERPVVRFDAGVEAALVQVLKLMQEHARAFGIDQIATGMSGFDPDRDVLEPPEW